MKHLFCLLTLALSISGQAQQSDTNSITPGAARQQMLLTLAIHDWKAGQHLPFMPDLHKPVHVKKGAWVCNTGGELLNPHKDVLVHLGECIQSPVAAKLIGVMEPPGEEEYVSDHMTGTVEVVWRGKEQSDANFYTAWVFVKDLSN